jgi:hypothetical protein
MMDVETIGSGQHFSLPFFFMIWLLATDAPYLFKMFFLLSLPYTGRYDPAQEDKIQVRRRRPHYNFVFVFVANARTRNTLHLSSSSHPLGDCLVRVRHD